MVKQRIHAANVDGLGGARHLQGYPRDHEHTNMAMGSMEILGVHRPGMSNWYVAVYIEVKPDTRKMLTGVLGQILHEITLMWLPPLSNRGCWKS